MKGNIGYQGKFYDQESGLYYYYHRYYHPGIGRFTTEDPIGFEGGINLYRFVENNPVNFTDLYGFKPSPMKSVSCIKALKELSDLCKDGNDKFKEGCKSVKKESEDKMYDEDKLAESDTPYMSNDQVRRGKSFISCALKYIEAVAKCGRLLLKI